jgi:hypothetical protein
MTAPACRPDRPVGQGEYGLNTESGLLFRLDTRGKALAINGSVGQQVHVRNAGVWDENSHAFKGLGARYEDGRWLIDEGDVRARNANDQSDMRRGRLEQFSIGGGRASTESKVEGDDQYLRMRAMESVDAIALATSGRLADLSGVPVTIRALVRTSGSHDVILTLYDFARESSGPTRVVAARQAGTGSWQTLTLIACDMRSGSPNDSVSVSMVSPQAGDTLDIREFSVLPGVFPR